MKRAWIWTLAILLGTGSVGYGATLEPEPGWVSVHHIEKAIKVAQKRNRILCFLWAWHESYWRTSAKRYMRSGGLGGMVKVLVYISDRPPSAVQKVREQVQEPDGMTPVMYFATPDDFSVLGFVQSDSRPKKVAEIAGFARKVFAWRKRAKKEVERADKLAAAGKFSAANKIYEKVINEDKAYTVLVHRSWDVVLTKDEADGLYFAPLMFKVDDLETEAEKRLEKATEHFENEEYAEAEKLIVPMVKDGADLEPVKKAAELLEKIREKMAAQKKAPPKKDDVKPEDRESISEKK